MRREMLGQLSDDQRGSFVIEAAIIIPILMTLAFGTFEVGSIVARQHQLQSAASEAAAIALAANQGVEVKIDTIRDILATSVDVPKSKISITRFYRCGDSATTVVDEGICQSKSTGEDAAQPVVTSYLRIDVRDQYTPVWQKFGIGKPIDFRIERTVML